MPGGIYGVSKCALHGLTVNLASELGGRNINVNGIAPGLVDNESGYASLPKDSPFRDALAATIPEKTWDLQRTSSARCCCCARRPATGSRDRRSSSTADGSHGCERGGADVVGRGHRHVLRPVRRRHQRRPVSRLRLREDAPIYHNDRYDFWALSRYEDVHSAC